HTPISSDTTFDGLTITAGYNDDTTNDGDDPNGSMGGGMFLDDADPVISHCTFTDNVSLAFGAAVMNQRGSNPTFISCDFVNNTQPVQSPFIEWGGAVTCFTGTVNFTDCRFTENGNTGRGGAIYCQEGHINVTGCTFTRNHGVVGGAIDVENSGSATIVNSVFNGNFTTSAYGGAVASRGNGATIANSTFV